MTTANPYTPSTTALPPLTVTGRLDRLRAAFGDHEIDALVVTTLANVRYLTGFAGSAGVLTVTRDTALLTTDGRYRTQSAEQVDKIGSVGAGRHHDRPGGGAAQGGAVAAHRRGQGTRPHRARGRPGVVVARSARGPTSSARTSSSPPRTRSKRSVR